jgi:hypothetical protein
MMNLQLYAMRDESTLALLKKMDKQRELSINPETCFWLGSVSCDNNVALQNFLKDAEQENLQELIKQASIDDHVAYAILVRDARLETQFHLFVIELGQGLWTEPKFLFGKKLSTECLVATKSSTTVPDGIVTHPKLELWKSFIGGFFRK